MKIATPRTVLRFSSRRTKWTYQSACLSDTSAFPSFPSPMKTKVNWVSWTRYLVAVNGGRHRRGARLQRMQRGCSTSEDRCLVEPMQGRSWVGLNQQSPWDNMPEMYAVASYCQKPYQDRKYQWINSWSWREKEIEDLLRVSSCLFLVVRSFICSHLLNL